MAFIPKYSSLRAAVRFGLFIKMLFFAKLIFTLWKGVRPLWKSQLLAFLCSTEGKASCLLPKPIQGINIFLHFAVSIFYPNHSQKEQSGNKTERNDLILSNQILDAAKVNSNNPSISIKSKFKSLLLFTMRQALIVRKNTLTDEEETRQRLAKMEKSLLLLAEQQNHILSVLNGITKWKLSLKGLPNNVVTTYWSTWCGVFSKVSYISNNCSWSWIACFPFNHQINRIHRSFCFFGEKDMQIFIWQLTSKIIYYTKHITGNKSKESYELAFDLVYICPIKSLCCRRRWRGLRRPWQQQGQW